MNTASTGPGTHDGSTLDAASEQQLAKLREVLRQQGLTAYQRPNKWTIADIAKHLGVTAATVRKYASNGPTVSPFMPPPSGYVGRTPWWRMETITDWHAARPGRGARTDLQKEQ